MLVDLEQEQFLAQMHENLEVCEGVICSVGKLRCATVCCKAGLLHIPSRTNNCTPNATGVLAGGNNTKVWIAKTEELMCKGSRTYCVRTSSITAQPRS